MPLLCVAVRERRQYNTVVRAIPSLDRSVSWLAETEEAVMEYQKLLQEVYAAAERCAKRGAGYSQQRVVLDEVARHLNSDAFVSPLEIKAQQEILTCWHDLFREGRLSWGYDLDNPDGPFFHVPARDTQVRLTG